MKIKVYNIIEKVTKKGEPIQVKVIKAEDYFKEEKEWINDYNWLAKAKNEIITQRENQMRGLKQHYLNAIKDAERNIDKRVVKLKRNCKFVIKNIKNKKSIQPALKQLYGRINESKKAKSIISKLKESVKNGLE